MITGIDIPASAAAQRSHYLKVRDRASFEFALVSAAVALDLDGRHDPRGSRGRRRRRHQALAPAGGRGGTCLARPLIAATLKAAADQAGAGAKPASMNAFKLVLLRRTVLRALQTVVGLKAACHGNDRQSRSTGIDARLKVTGAAQYAAEFTCPDVVHAVLVQSTIAAGSITGFDLKQAQGMPGVLAIITPDNAGKLSHPEKVPQAVRRSVAAEQGNPVQRPARRRGRRRDAGTGAGRRGAVRVTYTERRGRDVDGRHARAGLRPEEFPQRPAPAGFQSRRSRRHVQQRRGQGGRDLHHARSNTTTRWSRTPPSPPGTAAS